MPKPFTTLTGNGCHFHMSLWKDGDERVPRRGRPARARALRARLPLHRRPEGARARLQRADGADRQLVQAAEARLDVERRDLVAGLDLVRLQQPHPDAADPGARAGSRTARSTARATRTWRRPPCSPPASTGSRTGSTPASRTRRTSTAFSYDELTGRGLRSLPANLLEAIGELEQRRRPARRARPDARERGVRRLLRAGEARRVVPLPRAGERLGGARVPDALLRLAMCGIVGLFAKSPGDRGAPRRRTSRRCSRR